MEVRSKIFLTLPPLEEQRKIASILTEVDDVIDCTQRQIDNLKNLKTAMMQELLMKGISPQTDWFRWTPP